MVFSVISVWNILQDFTLMTAGMLLQGLLSCCLWFEMRGFLFLLEVDPFHLEMRRLSRSICPLVRWVHHRAGQHFKLKSNQRGISLCLRCCRDAEMLWARASPQLWEDH